MKIYRKYCAFLLIALLLIGLTGCGGGQTPTDVTKQFLDAIKSKDSKKIEKVYAGKELEIVNNGLTDLTGEKAEESTETSFDEENSKLFEEKLLSFDYEMSNEKIEDNKATVDVSITTYKIGDAFTNILSNYIQEAFALAFSGALKEEINKVMNSCFKDEFEKLEKKEFQKTATVSLTKGDDGWTVDEIEDDSEFMDAITGGMVSIVKGWGDAFGQGGND